MEHTGWRKPTPGLLRAEKLAKAGEQETIGKNEALIAVKRVAPSIGARAGELMMLDLLAAFTRPQDWEKGARPIVWPSNDFLMAHSGYSRTGLKMCLRRLTALGLIAFKDSSNGKRFGKRDEAGRIIEAFGIDLSPLAARHQEFTVLYQGLEEERALIKGLKRQITISRRSIRALLEAHSGTGLGLHDLWERFEALLERLKAAGSSVGQGATVGNEERINRLIELKEALKELRENVVKATSSAVEFEEESHEAAPPANHLKARKTASLSIINDPSGAENRPHIQITNECRKVTRNINEKRKGQGADIEPNRQPSQKERSDQHSKDTKGEQIETAEVELATVMQACPDFAEIAHGLSGYVRNWAEFSQLASQIRPMAGISENAWQMAQTEVGPHLSSAMLALIYDKYSKGEVKSPGGYLRGMIDKAKCGELNLARSFYGRLNETR